MIIFIPLFHLVQLYLCLGSKLVALDMIKFWHNLQTISVISKNDIENCHAMSRVVTGLTLKSIEIRKTMISTNYNL